MLKYVYDQMSQGKMKDGLKEVCAALDKAVKHCNPNAEIFFRIDLWSSIPARPGLTLLHLAVVTPPRAAAGNWKNMRAGWISLGKVADPTTAIVERLRRHWYESNCIYAFFHSIWVGTVTNVPVPIEVSAPAQLWGLLQDYKGNVTEQMKVDWATLTEEDGSVDFAYLQVLPDFRMLMLGAPLAMTT
jgi:hypothetical protein